MKPENNFKCRKCGLIIYGIRFAKPWKYDYRIKAKLFKHQMRCLHRNLYDDDSANDEANIQRYFEELPTGSEQ